MIHATTRARYLAHHTQHFSLSTPCSQPESNVGGVRSVRLKQLNALSAPIQFDAVILQGAGEFWSAIACSTICCVDLCQKPWLSCRFLCVPSPEVSFMSPEPEVVAKDHPRLPESAWKNRSTPPRSSLLSFEQGPFRIAPTGREV